MIKLLQPAPNLNAATTSKVALLTEPGLEFVVRRELYELLKGSQDVTPYRIERSAIIKGIILLEVDLALPQAIEKLSTLRSIHLVLTPLCVVELSEDWAAQAESISEQLDLSSYLQHRSFRVSARRSGVHKMSSQDFAAELGKHLCRKINTSVDLRNYQVEISLDIVDRTILVSLQHQRRSLSKRHIKPYAPQGALKPIIAYAMLQLAGVTRGSHVVHDPFCGSGTILVEAALANKQLVVSGSDHNEIKIKGAEKNLKACGIDYVPLAHCPADHFFNKLPNPGRVDAIVTNLPFGFKVAAKKNFTRLYREVLTAANHVLTNDGCIVVLTCQIRELKQVVVDIGGWRITHLRRVAAGGLHPAMIRLVRA